MNRLIGCLLLLFGLTIPVLAQTSVKATIIINNPSKLERQNAVVPVNWKTILSKYPDLDTTNFKVLNSSTKEEVPFQLEYKGMSVVQNLLVQISIKANGISELLIVPGKPALTVRKTYGRYVPERYDDFAWENDKIAFRMYGKALEERKDNAFGTDVWVKRTNKLVINDWYKSGDYHKDHGDGMDYYDVGFTMGAGDIAPYVNDTIVFSKNYRNWKVLDNGPLRFTFQLGYDQWDVAGRLVKVIKTISLDAGSHLNKVEANYLYKDTANIALPVVVGIIKRKQPGKILLDEKKGIMAYWEPEHGQDGIIGVGTITTGAKMNERNGHLLTHLSAKNNKPVTYYNGAAWNKANEITNEKEWFNYLNNFQMKLQQPLTVSVK